MLALVSKPEHIKQLAEEIIADAELMRLSVESLVLKASRLARLVEDEEAIKWLEFERNGYLPDDPIAKKYIYLTNRWVNYSEKKGYFSGVATQEATLQGIQHQLDVIKSFQPSGTYATMQFTDQHQRIINATTIENAMRRVLSGIRMCVQAFATRIYNEAIFSAQASSIFEEYQKLTDAALASTAEKAFDRLPAAFERLSEGSEEAISHALTTCRRVLDSFTDSVFPPQQEHFLIGEQPIIVDALHTRNRMRAYIFSRIGQCARYEKIKKTYNAVYDRVSAGVHADVDAAEARAIVLQTYLILGECLSLPEQPPKP